MRGAKVFKAWEMNRTSDLVFYGYRIDQLYFDLGAVLATAKR